MDKQFLRISLNFIDALIQQNRKTHWCLTLTKCRWAWIEMLQG